MPECGVEVSTAELAALERALREVTSADPDVIGDGFARSTLDITWRRDCWIAGGAVFVASCSD
jgi:hypothetical protein